MQSIQRANFTRFATKKALKEAVLAGEDVRIEATSYFGNEYDGPISKAPAANYAVVGPSPEKRVWFAQVIKSADGKVVVK